MEFVISPIWTFLELAFIYFFFYSFLPQKIQKRRWLYFILAWVICCLYTLSPLPQIVCSCLSVVVILVFSFVLFSGFWLWHVLLTIMAISIVFVFDLCFSYAACILLKIDTTTLIMQKYLYISVVSASKLLVLLASWLSSNIRREKESNGTHWTWLLLTLLFPAVSLVIQFAILFYFRENDELTKAGFAVNCALAISNIGIIYLIQHLQKDTLEKQRLALLNQQMTIQVQSIESLEKSYRAQRSASHEYIHNLTTIRGLLDKGEIEELRSFVGMLLGKQTSRILAVRSSHPIIDAIMNQKYQQAQEKGIDCQIKVNDLSSISISADYLVVMLSNLMDNAIEACVALATNREILASIIAEERLWISVRNTSAPVSVTANTLQTSKYPTAEHGFGFQNITEIIAALHGEYTVQYENGWFTFAAEIPLGVSK